jgi:hypothetical protein
MRSNIRQKVKDDLKKGIPVVVRIGKVSHVCRNLGDFDRYIQQKIKHDGCLASTSNTNIL